MTRIKPHATPLAIAISLLLSAQAIAQDTATSPTAQAVPAAQQNDLDAIVAYLQILGRLTDVAQVTP